MPQFAETIRKEIFPRVTVSIQNEASHSVYLKCGFDRVDQNLRRLEPGQTTSWTFYEILFPLRWCYVHINNEIHGAFWAFTVALKCTHCTWSLRDDGCIGSWQISISKG
ncbi:Plant self-incompatibility S1 - like 4 [Theobroma cacao]|nr:Plant self-incompatibility S1 - like 4 [Theobroma cacao]